MSLRRPAVAWTLLALTVACETVAVLLPDRNFPTRGLALVAVPVLLTATCGGLVAARRSKNPSGWILEGIALSIAVSAGATQYAQRALVVAPGSLPGGVAGAWLQSWVASAAVPLIVQLLLLFPTGTFLSSRWRPVAWIASTATIAIVAYSAFRPGPFDTFPHVRNPLGVHLVSTIAGVAGPLVTPAVALAFAGAVASVIVRFRRSRGIERRQMKWFAFATVIALALAIANSVTHALNAGFIIPGLRLDAGFAVLVAGAALIPIAIAVAILRHRAFDIDRIISRTVSYAIVTAMLAGMFALLVLLPTTVIGSRARTPQWLVAVATLAVAALFQPIRLWVQRTVDRRFNRARYDAARTIDSFSARLREEIDIDALGAELREVVTHTMQPEHVTLWMRS